MADQTATLSSELVEVLPAETVRQTGFTHRFSIPYTQVKNSAWTTDGDTVTLTLGSTPTKWLVDKVAVDIKTAFTTDGTLTIQVGTDGDPDNFLDAQDAKTAALLLADTSATVKTEAGSFGIASDVLVARFTTQAATGAPSDISAGEAVVYLAIRDFAGL
jgi:hypothetical protein